MPYLALQYFNQLSTNERYGILEDHGYYTDTSYMDGTVRVALFNLFDYFVEVQLDEANNNLLSAKAFLNNQRLEPFISSIDISDLLEAY